MKKVLSIFNTPWWLIIVISGLFCLPILLQEYFGLLQIGLAAYLLFSLGILGTLFFVFENLKRKKYSRVILAIGFLSISTLVLYFNVNEKLVFIESSSDEFYEDIYIADTTRFFEPKELLDGSEGREIDNNYLQKPSLYSFEIFNSYQPGQYVYEIWLGKIDSGIVYLKVYEISRNTRLSEGRIKETSRIDVFNPAEKLKKFESKGAFTIYEGDWGKPYGARIEVWYQTNAGKERKLSEKNYLVEGWQR